MIFLADTAFGMSDLDNFDNDKISWKLAQIQPYVFVFYGKISVFLWNQDGSENTKWNLFKNHPIIPLTDLEVADGLPRSRPSTSGSITDHRAFLLPLHLRYVFLLLVFTFVFFPSLPRAFNSLFPLLLTLPIAVLI